MTSILQSDETILKAHFGDLDARDAIIQQIEHDLDQDYPGQNIEGRDQADEFIQRRGEELAQSRHPDFVAACRSSAAA